MRPAASLFCALIFAATTAGCSRGLQKVLVPPGQPAGVAELWVEPTDIQSRDLFHGPGGQRLLPRDDSYAFVRKDTSGWSPGFDVRSRDGVEWSVKLGPEAQTEVVASRILWAIGFHQPPTYYVERWTLTGQQAGPQPAGRFRPTLPDREVVGDWSWYENPFVGSREFGGLIVVNVLLNNWDWKTSNNKIYRVSPPANGVSRWFVVRDLGASLGKTGYVDLLKWIGLRRLAQGTRNDLPGFEAQGFITRMDGSRVEFDYDGVNDGIVNAVTPEDVRWTCRLLSRLSDPQLADAFRAGGYTPDQGARYVKKIKAKIAQGLP